MRSQGSIPARRHRAATASAHIAMTPSRHQHTTTPRPIRLLPASLLRHRPGPTIAGSHDVLILVPDGHPDLLERLRRIARAFRDRGRRVALRRVSAPAASAPAASAPAVSAPSGCSHSLGRKGSSPSCPTTSKVIMEKDLYQP
jgi:hypothetical protein